MNISDIIDAVHIKYQDLTHREKIAIFTVSSLIIVIIITQFLVIPFYNNRAKLVKTITQKKEDLSHIQQLSAEYKQLSKDDGEIKQKLATRPSSFSLFTFLDHQSEVVQIKNKIRYMKPSEILNEDGLDESQVEMKIQEIGLDRLVEFLTLIESDRNVIYIRHLSIQQHSHEPGFLDAVIQVVTFKSES